LLRIFLHHDRIGARRDGRTGKDPRDGVGGERLRRLTGCDTLRNRQTRRAGKVGHPHGPTIALGVVGGRYVDART
jgi:hypothetical protein